MAKILDISWKFIIKQICFVDKEEYDKKIKEKEENKLRLQGIQELIDDNNLYCIIPYFNFCKSVTRRKLFLEFIERYKNIENLKLIVIEASNNKEEFDLPENIDGVFDHIAIYIKNIIWIKENLINIAINKLPKYWKYCSWVDADLTFLNTNWVNDTIKELDNCDALQLFESAVNLGPTGETFKLDQGFVKQYKTSDREYDRSHKYGYWHPGYGWAINRKLYDKFVAKNSHILPDFAILGSGDHHMSLSFIGCANNSYPDNISDEYKEKIKNYEKVCKKIGISLGYINGTIVHHWHGSLKNRKYVERWQIFIDNNYNPYTDIKYDENGIIELTEEGTKLIEPIVKYFDERKEDSVEL